MPPLEVGDLAFGDEAADKLGAALFAMSDPDELEPPGDGRYSFDGALCLLATLEDARDELVAWDRFAEVVGVDRELQRLGRK